MQTLFSRVLKVQEFINLKNLKMNKIIYILHILLFCFNLNAQKDNIKESEKSPIYAFNEKLREYGLEIKGYHRDTIGQLIYYSNHWEIGNFKENLDFVKTSYLVHSKIVYKRQVTFYVYKDSISVEKMKMKIEDLLKNRKTIYKKNKYIIHACFKSQCIFTYQNMLVIIYGLNKENKRIIKKITNEYPICFVDY